MEVKISYVDLARQWEDEKLELLPIIEKTMASGQFVLGEIVEKFEENIASLTGAKYVVSLNSGTDALVCSLAALGVRAGDEVITPPNSFVASTSAITHLGAKPIFADVLEDQMINPEKIRSLITEKTKAIMPVHLTGRMARMDEISAIGKEFGIPIIEDSAQSIFSKFNGIQSGVYGDVGCFSTHPLKNLNASGDGGFVITNSEDIAKQIRQMRNHGMVDRNTVEKFGFVSRMDSLQAAILSYRLKKIDSVIEKRRSNAKIYRQLLNNSKIYSPDDTDEYFNTYHTFVVQLDNRDEAQKFLAERGIQTAIHYPVPIHLQPAAKNLGYNLGDFPETEAQAKKILSLPINQFLDPYQIETVANTINDFVGAV